MPICAACGIAFKGHGLRKTCSASCHAWWRREYKKVWRNSHLEQERARVRDAERRRKRRWDPEALEKRRAYMRERYRKMSSSYLALVELNMKP